MNQKKINYIIIFLTIVIIMPTFSQTTTSAPPPEPVTYTAYVHSDESSYVYQGLPSMNYNTGMDKYNLMIGQDEFNHDYQFYVKFNAIDLPSDAVIKSAKIRLWCSEYGSDNALTEMRKVTTFWNEDTLNWSNKPSVSSTIDQKNVGIDGPYDFNAFTLVEDWVDTPSQNYGVLFVNEQYDQFFSYVFYSDNDATHSPRLQITYETSTGEEPDPPEEPSEDTTPCEIEYMVSPENPQSGNNVTISVTATDDVAMQYISIQKAAVEVKFCEAVGTQTTLTCSYSEVLNTGTYIFSIFADDKGGESPVGETFTVEVEGTGSDPIVTLEIEFEHDDATPAKYQILPMDGQQIDIKATATDPDGIDFMTITVDGIPVDFTFDPPQTEVERWVSVENGNDILDDCSAPCTLRYSVRAYDTEGRSTRVEGEDIEIGVPWQWYWGLPFANWGCDENHTWSWSMMESIFGDEVWWNEEHGWRKPHADYLYKNKVKEGGRGGQCYGMCALSLELASTSSSIYANMIQPTAVSIDDLEREEWNNTWPYYYARQAGQYSFHRLFLKSAQYLLQPERSGSGLHPFIDDILDDIIDDLNAGTPGIISIFEGSKGHAVIPWRVVPLGGDMYNVFIYDPNHAHASTHDSMDFTNFNQYPFIVFGEDGWARDGWWSYEWNSTSTWNENIYYTPYDTMIGNPSSKNYIGTTPTTVGITDQRLPDPMQTLMYGSGDASFYAEDTSGRKTGYVNGELIAEIPYSAPIHESDGSVETVDMFMLPSNVTLTIHSNSTVGSEDDAGVYSLMLWHNTSLYTFENVTSTKGTKDEIIFTPSSTFDEVTDHSVRFKRGDVTKLRASDPLDYTITIAKEFYNSPFVGRVYSFTSDQNDEGAEIELYVSEDHDDFVVETFDSPFTFSVTTKSTESLENDPQVDYIPESKGSFSMDANEKMAVTPDNWATTLASGSFSTGKEQNDTDDEPNDQTQGDDSTTVADETPGFEGIILCIALILGLVYYRRKKHSV